MTPAEARFKCAVRAVVERGDYPSPTKILGQLGMWDRARRRHPGGPNLNGRECRWRREVFGELGWRPRPGRIDRWGRSVRPLRGWAPPE